MNHTSKITYWIATILLCLVFLYSAQMYFFNTEQIEGFFANFNYPSYLVIPLAIAKILAVVMILWRKITWLTEWAYAGLCFDLILASTAHFKAGHGIGLSIYAIPLLFISYFIGKKVRSTHE